MAEKTSLIILGDRTLHYSVPSPVGLTSVQEQQHIYIDVAAAISKTHVIASTLPQSAVTQTQEATDLKLALTNQAAVQELQASPHSPKPHLVDCCGRL